MTLIQFLDSFRVRLMFLFLALLIATLGLQYFLNLRSQNHTARVVGEQEQALAAGVELGVRSLSSPNRLTDLLAQGEYPILSASSHRVRNILVIDDHWQVYDNLDSEYQPSMENGKEVFKQIRDVPLPPIINAGQYASDLLAQIQQTAVIPDQARASAPRTFPFPVETEEGRWYVIVVLGSANPPSNFSGEVARPLMYLLSILLVATVAAGYLVWRFTRPIKELSSAAGRVALGDFSFHVPAANRGDEMGELARVFNEMIAKLGRTRELEAQLHQSEQSAVVGRLASAIAHEIRNPLNYINLTLDHLRSAFAPEQPEKKEAFDRLAAQLKTEVARINTRISEFLNYTRPSKLDFRALDIRAEIDDALKMVEIDAAEHEVEASLVQEGSIPTVMGDPKALRSVFTNLMINGLQAIAGERGKLTILLLAEPGTNSVTIEVTDTGRGIQPEDISKVFEPYFSTKETGTGLGLAIVKKVVEDHSGTIGVKSKLGEGTTFKITLPTNRKDNG